MLWYYHTINANQFNARCEKYQGDYKPVESISTWIKQAYEYFSIVVYSELFKDMT